MTYPQVPARFDYGPRKGPTLGLMLHCSESNAGLVGYLARNPARGVSANFVCESTGRLVQMLPLDHASGSLNPNDRSSDKPYYGHSHLVDVLGDWWKDPNSAVISVEIECFAKTGPNGRQAKSLVDWAADMVKHYPSIRGALGHADQTDTKPCPGTTSQMKAIFASIGGHGLWTPAEEPVLRSYTFGPDARSGTFTSDGKPGHLYLRLKDNTLHPYPEPLKKHAFGPVELTDGGITGPADTRKTGYVIGDEAAFVLQADGSFIGDADDQIAAQRERDRVAMLAATEEVFAA